MTQEEQIFEILYKGKMAWTAVKEPLFSSAQEPTSGYGIFRSDTRENLGVVGGKYLPHQNYELVKEFIESVSEFGITNVEGIAVDGGKKVILKARLGDMQIGKDTVHRYITASNTHNGTSQIKLGMQNVILVCSNGLTRELNSHELASVKHTTNAGEKMNWYIRNLPKVIALEEQMMRNYQKLSEVKANKKHIQAIIEATYQVDTTLPVEEISTHKKNQVELFDKALMNNGLNVHGNTLWGCLQAMTYISSHDTKGAVDVEKSLIGVNAERSLLTYSMLMEMIDNPVYEMEEVEML